MRKNQQRSEFLQIPGARCLHQARFASCERVSYYFCNEYLGEYGIRNRSESYCVQWIRFLWKMLELTKSGGLFDHFEVNSEPFWPKLGRLLGGSAIFHLIIATCILLIPPVRDALSVAVMFRGGGFV